MAINFDPSVNSISANTAIEKMAAERPTENKVNFGKAMTKYINDVNSQQVQSDVSIVDLISGKTQDINSVVASVAKADMSFKLLVGVRNKLVTAYKEVMKMQV